MRLITVKLVHADGRIIKVNVNEVPAWNSRGFSIPKEGKTSSGEPRADNANNADEPKDKPEDKPATDKQLGGVII